MNIIEKAAEILASTKHNKCTAWGYISGVVFLQFNLVEQRGRNAEKVEPFTDTIQGRRQVDIIEDWLIWNEQILWHIQSKRHIKSTEKGKPKSSHQWRLDRIKWCLEQLCK